MFMLGFYMLQKQLTYLNTELQKVGLTTQIVQAVTEHKTAKMTEHYTHFNPMEFGDIPEIQAALLAGKPEKKKMTALPCL
jgi:hypothetical protein